MSPRQPLSAPKAKLPGRHWIWIVRLLLASAMVGSAGLAWVSFSGDRLPGCGPESGCNEILNSPWSRFWHVPVSLGALLVYATLAAATRSFSPGISPLLHRTRRGVLLFGSVVTLMAAAWFVGLQIFWIGAFCPYCNLVHACGSSAALLILLKVPLVRPRGHAPRPQKEVLLAPPVAGRLAFGAVITVAAFGLGQTLHPTGLIVSRPLPQGSGPEVAAAAGPMPSGSEVQVSADGQLRSEPARPQRVLRLHGGTFEFDLEEIPMSGAADAPYLVANLFDYTCRHCRVLHGFLKEAQHVFGDQLGIVNLPSPLDPTCNPLLPRHLPEHTNACEYARIGLTVWRANRVQGEAFDEWMFTPPRPPALDEAREHAISLVGAEAFARLNQDPWIDHQLDRYTQLFALNYRSSGLSRLPQLMIGTNIVVGDFRRANDLFRVLSNHLNLATPASQP